MSDYPHCKNCNKIVHYSSFGYIDCQVWGACLGYNNAADCPFYELKERNKDDQK